MSEPRVSDAVIAEALELRPPLSPLTIDLLFDLRDCRAALAAADAREAALRKALEDIEYEVSKLRGHGVVLAIGGLASNALAKGGSETERREQAMSNVASMALPNDVADLRSPATPGADATEER